ncbi:MAG: B3/4 domain-containing protein, partial [Gordonibacter urolithinfaciens]
MQKFIAEESFWELFPDAAIGILVVRGMKSANDVPAEDAAAIAKLLREANATADQHLTSNTISENEVVRVWREAFQKFKTKKGARCSVENLLKRVLKGNPVGSITPSVDIYNAVSLKYALPVGGEDVDSFVGDFRLGLTEGGDAFLPIGEDAEDPTLPGELCYRDDEGAVCRCWNWRDGQRSALKDDSANAILVM